MKEPSQSTVMIVDNDKGLFVPLAVHLARAGDFKRVLYQGPRDGSYPMICEGMCGDGFDNLERVEDFWLPEIKNEIDLWCYPDINMAGEQLELESQGFLVWGSRRGDMLEKKRQLFHRTLGDIGLEVPPNHVCHGLDELWEFLQDQENVYIKISRFRGTHETKKFRNMDLDEGLLYKMGVKFWPVQNEVDFIVCFDIPTDLEIGGDTYSIDGDWPSLMLHGLEKKDRGYFAAVTKREEMPDQIQEIMEAIGPVLREERYRNQISFEDRVAGDKHYWIDATQRGGLPSSASQYSNIKNLAEVLLHGAAGELVEPEYEKAFVGECMMTMKGEKDMAGKCRPSPEVEEWMNCAFSFKVDGALCFGSDPSNDGNEIGWLCASGDTPEEFIENMKQLADDLPDGIDADTDSLVDLIAEAHKEQEEGITFTKEPLPKPEIALNI